MDTKKCSRCGCDKPISEFSKGRGAFGKHSVCKVCDSEIHVIRKHGMSAEDKAERAAYEKQWREKNADRLKELSTKWRDANRETLNEKKRAYYEKNRDAISANAKAQRKENPERYSADKRKKRSESARLRNTRFTPEQYAACLDLQGGKCAICETELSALPTGRVHADHCHISMAPRGILCAKCNHGIGLLGESENRLQKAIDYLRTPPLWSDLA